MTFRRPVPYADGHMEAVQWLMMQARREFYYGSRGRAWESLYKARAALTELLLTLRGPWEQCPDPRKPCRLCDRVAYDLQEERMDWQGYTTAGWAKLLRAVAALEKQYGVRIFWKEKFGTLRLRPQVGFSVEREIPWAEVHEGEAGSVQAAAPEYFPESSPPSPLSEEDEADLRALCAAIEAASINTCQVCGVRGEVRQQRMPDDRWVMNLCEKCAQRRTRFVVQRCEGRGHPRAPYVEGMLYDACDRHRQDLQYLLPLLAQEEFQTIALGKILAEIPTPPRGDALPHDTRSQAMDAKACERLLQEYVEWLEAVGKAMQSLPCGETEKGGKERA